MITSDHWLATLDRLDGSLLLTLNGNGPGWLDSLMYTATGRFFWIPFYVFVLWVMVRRLGWRRALLWTLVIAAAIAVTDQIIASAIRPWVGRLRPANLDNPLSAMVNVVDGYRGGRYGFPSCHGGNSAALATLVALIVRRRWMTWTMVVWAVLNSYTRLYLGVHYPGDILAGAAIGVSVALLFYLCFRRVCGVS